MLTWLAGLFSASTNEQVRVLEQKAPTFEERLDRIVAQSRGFREKNQVELNDFIEDVDSALSILERAIDVIDRGDLEFRAVRVQTRLKKAKTRAINQQRVA